MLLWMQGSLVAMVPSIGFPITMSVALNPRIVAFTALACVLTALVSGASPALFVFRSNLNEVLKEGSRSDTAGKASRRTRSLLVIGEVALATVALVGAGLFVRSFQNIRRIHPGFDPDPVLFGRFFSETTGYTGDRSQQFAVRLKERLHAVAGMEGASYTDWVPLSTTAGPYKYGEGGRVHGRAGRIDDGQPRAGVAGVLRHLADSVAGGPGLQPTGRWESSAGDDRQPDIRQALLPRSRIPWAARCGRWQVSARWWGWRGTANTSARRKRRGPISIWHFPQFYQRQPGDSTSWCAPRAIRSRRFPCCGGR